jgi:hypothetical protein
MTKSYHLKTCFEITPMHKIGAVFPADVAGICFSSASPSNAHVTLLDLTGRLENGCAWFIPRAESMQRDKNTVYTYSTSLGKAQNPELLKTNS